MADDGARRRKGGRRGVYKVKQNGWQGGPRGPGDMVVSYVCGTTFFFWWTLVLAWSGGEEINTPLLQYQGRGSGFGVVYSKEYSTCSTPQPAMLD